MNPFATLALGYAKWRPPIHQLILEKANVGQVERALDLGCGSGVSTRALEGMAASRIGMDPAETMVQCGSAVAPGATFLVGKAEQIPVRDQSLDLIAAAGSLNYSDPARFFPEAVRVLKPGGLLLVYDFSTGRPRDGWFDAFIDRYPFPASEALELNPEILGRIANGFRMTRSETFEITLTLDQEFLVHYMLTETNVAAAIRRGVPEAEIRQWCEATLRAGDVVFRGYFACLTPDR